MAPQDVEYRKPLADVNERIKIRNQVFKGGLCAERVCSKYEGLAVAWRWHACLTSDNAKVQGNLETTALMLSYMRAEGVTSGPTPTKPL